MLISILSVQILVMALLVILGMFLTRKNYLSSGTTKELGSILLYFVIPSLIIKAYCAPYSPQKMDNLGYAWLLTFILYSLSISIAWIIFGTKYPVDNFAASFSNAGFIGIPLLYAVFGADSVFYLAPTIAYQNIAQYTYGRYLLVRNAESVSFRKLFMNPMFGALFLGVLLFVGRIELPQFIITTLDYICSLNTPVSMLLIGSYLTTVPVKNSINIRLALCVFTRLVLTPLIGFIVVYCLYTYEPMVTMVVFLGLSTPVGANVCVYARQFGACYEYSVLTVCLSTLCCVLTIPLWTLACQILLS